MPLYYLDIHNTQGLYNKDYHGTDLPNCEAARTEALKVAHELYEAWCNDPPELLAGMAVEVVDEIGQSVLTVPFPRGRRSA
ncbi:DUF6894 family protein [Microvirga arvi]|uniref:DUF6894 family protein n=1 Tax=Microvirga arvi TaxID=2778731 RepID=UPI00355829D1